VNGIVDTGFVTADPRVSCILWGIANGPLALACLALHNSLIFHDIENTASLFIHFSPGITSWTMRWYSLDYHLKWPGVFGMPLTEDYNIKFL